MKHVKYIFLAVFAQVLFISCNNNDCCDPGPLIDTYYHLSVISSDGTDLLDPEVNGTLNTHQIAIYDLIDGEAVPLDLVRDTYPWGYTISQMEEGYVMQPQFGGDDDLVYEGIIQWNDSDSDTIRLEFEQPSRNQRRIVRIYCNGVWDRENDQGAYYRGFQIIK